MRKYFKYSSMLGITTTKLRSSNTTDGLHQGCPASDLYSPDIMPALLSLPARDGSYGDTSFKGHIIQETRHLRNASSNERIVQGTHCPRDASIKGRIVQGRMIPDKTYRDGKYGDVVRHLSYGITGFLRLPWDCILDSIRLEDVNRLWLRPQEGQELIFWFILLELILWMKELTVSLCVYLWSEGRSCTEWGRALGWVEGRITDTRIYKDRQTNSQTDWQKDER